MNDNSRSDATDNDPHEDQPKYIDAEGYSLSVEDVRLMFSSAGIPRSDRTIQRWCEDGHLRCSKYPTETGSKYFVQVESAQERLEAIRQVQTKLAPPSSTAKILQLPNHWGPNRFELLALC